MERRQALLGTMGLAGLSVLGARNLSAQNMTSPAGRFGDKIIPPEKEKGQEKHVPMIEAPQHATKGQKFNVTVQVGKVVAHPNTVEHHIKTIELYALAEGSPYVVKIGAVELGPTVADPTVTFSVMLQSPSTLYALAYCNIHGVWDNSAAVHVM